MFQSETSRAGRVAQRPGAPPAGGATFLSSVSSAAPWREARPPPKRAERNQSQDQTPRIPSGVSVLGKVTYFSAKTSVSECQGEERIEFLLLCREGFLFFLVLRSQGKWM